MSSLSFLFFCFCFCLLFCFLTFACAQCVSGVSQGRCEGRCEWRLSRASSHTGYYRARVCVPHLFVRLVRSPRGNTDLFTHYGFTLEHNPFNYGPLCVVLGRDEARSDRGRVLREAFGRSGEGGAAKWLTSCGGDTDSPAAVAAAVAAAGESINDAQSVFRCRLHQDLLDEQSVECFALLRALLASDASWSQVVSPRIAADSAARSAHKAAAGDEDDLPAASVAALDAIDWNNEREVVRRVYVCTTADTQPADSVQAHEPRVRVGWSDSFSHYLARSCFLSAGASEHCAVASTLRAPSS